MKKYLLLAMLATLTIPFYLSADSNLEENLKAVMVLFDKSRKEAEAKNHELINANDELTASNLELQSDLELAKNQLNDLQHENIILRSKISEVAVRELETAALTMTTEIPVKTSQSRNDKAEPIPDFTPKSFKTVGAPANGAQHLSDATVLLVNINTATDRELRLIPGIGPAMATKLIENRPFASVWDLMKIQGMGKKRIESLQLYITLK